MDTIKMNESIFHLNGLKQEAQAAQRKGLPFILASVVIWGMILALQFLDKTQTVKNLYAFCCSSFLVPLSFLFSKIVKAKSFQKSHNPLSKLGILFTLNQMLYLIIVMWAFNQKPEAMVMLYAVVFGAHLLPFGWLYDSKAYTVLSVVETIGALLVGIFLGNVGICAFMALMELLLCIFLFLGDCKRAERPEMESPLCEGNIQRVL